LRRLSLAFLALALTLNAQPEKSAHPLTAPRILPAESSARLAPSARYHLAEIPALRLNALSATERRPIVRRGLTSIGLERQTGATSGHWETVAGNQQLWRLRIVSPGAESVQLHLRNVNHARGKFFVSGQELTASGNTLWSPAIPGDELTLEYEPLPGDNTHNLPFEIAGLVHIYAPLATAAPSCYVDVACSPNPRADSVGFLTFTNPDDHATYSCTGTLVNIANASADFEAVPLFLTAGHCMTTQDEAASANIRFHYEAATCGDSQSGLETSVMPPATLLATTSMEQGDHALLRLPSFPVNGYYPEPVLAGWSAGDLPQTGLFSLHHVGGLLMKESQGFRLPDGDATVGGVPAPADQFFRVGFSYGAAGEGASGAGIFDSSGTLFGTLSYGPPGSCQMYAGFGRMTAGFDALAPWLSGPQGGVSVSTLTSPASGAALDSTSAKFEWTRSPDALGYSLSAGTTGPGSLDVEPTLYTPADSTALTGVIDGIPQTVTNLWVRLTTRYPFGSWYNDAVYQVYTPQTTAITSPQPGQWFTGSLSWTPIRALTYTVTIGDTGPGSDNLFSQVIPNYKGTFPGITAQNVPFDGRTVYVRLAWTTLTGSGYRDYTWQTLTRGTPIRMLSPVPGSLLSAGSSTFEWTPVPGAISYDLIAYLPTGTVEVDGLTGTTGVLTGIPGQGENVDVSVKYHLTPSDFGFGYQSFRYTAPLAGMLPPSIPALVGSLTPGTWASIYGNNLSQTTRTWTAGDFVNGKLPTSLDDVSVLLNGQNAYVSYVSPGQVNFLVPASCCGQSPATVTVVNSLGQNSGGRSPVNDFAPSLFSLPQMGGMYAIATFPDGSLEGPAGLLGDTAKTRPVQAGGIITLWASGLGQTSPAYPDGQLITQPLPLANSVSVQIGGADAQIDYAGLVEAGLYQLNVHVPNIPSGDEPVSIKIGQYTSPGPLYISVQ